MGKDYILSNFWLIVSKPSLLVLMIPLLLTETYAKSAIFDGNYIGLLKQVGRQVSGISYPAYSSLHRKML